MFYFHTLAYTFYLIFMYNCGLTVAIKRTCYHSSVSIFMSETLTLMMVSDDRYVCLSAA